jgi:hypothetical protein
MAGFFGLFGSKTKYVDEPDTNESAGSSQKEEFFLSADEAKTLGDVNFMRQSKTVRRTFAKTKSGGGGELVQEISSLGKTKKGGPQASPSAATSSSAPTPEATSPSKAQETASKRRRSDSSMDMFRNMAKDLRK